MIFFGIKSPVPRSVPEWQQSKKAFDKDECQRLESKGYVEIKLTFRDDPVGKSSTSLFRSSYNISLNIIYVA